MLSINSDIRQKSITDADRRGPYPLNLFSITGKSRNSIRKYGEKVYFDPKNSGELFLPWRDRSQTF
jgi:hypothetical protein